MKPKIIKYIDARFVFKNPPIIDEDPDYGSLNEIIQALYIDTANLPTTLAGGAYGHVGIVMKDTLYPTLSVVIP